MLRAASLAVLLCASVAAPAATPLTPRTLRLDYVHTGTVQDEHFALDGLVLEGPWPGRLDRRLDDSGLGAVRFEVLDRQGRTLDSRAFATLFDEWATTAEARAQARSFHESVRFPLPDGPVEVVLERRGPHGEWRPVWRVSVDPRDPAIERASPARSPRVVPLLESGAPADKLDLAILGDGYTAEELPKLERDARRLSDALLSHEPYRSRRGDLNIWLVATPADESGVSRPSDGVYRRSPLRVAYDAFGMERYVLSFDNKRVREAAAAAPYEALVLLVNERKYGGGGIFGLYATVAADNAYAPYILVHELGHHLAGLADEYYLSSVAYEPAAGERREPWAPNVTADSQATRWRELIASDTPLPTSWPKAEYETLVSEMQARRKALREARRPEDEMEALFREEQRRTRELLSRAPWAGRAGAFEGAMYEARGYYRPAVDCLMFSRNDVGFCPVCQRAITRVLDLYTRPAAQPPGP
jgi:hypothetical protein